MNWRGLVAAAAMSMLVGCGEQSTSPTNAVPSIAQRANASDLVVGPAGVGDFVLTGDAFLDETVHLPEEGGDAGSKVPRAVVEEFSHDFGTLDLNEVGEHRFAVRNEGTAPLELRPIASTCTCITLEIEQPVIGPGEEAHIAVYWKSGEVKEHFAQATSVKTNDPELPMIQFKVRGSYLPVVAAEPAELFLPRVEPDQAAQAQALIVSQRLDDFSLANWECSLDGIEWDLQEARPADLARLNAKSGWRLTVKLPTNLPEGPFQHWLSFDVVRAATDAETSQPAPQRLEMPLVGKVLRRLTIHGKNIDENGMIQLGTVVAGSGQVEQYLVKVRDPETELGVDSIETTPSSLKASLAPYGDGSQKGLYALRIEVAADAPHGVYRDRDAGQVAIRFDHPRISELRLTVDFVVAPPKRFSSR